MRTVPFDPWDVAAAVAWDAHAAAVHMTAFGPAALAISAQDGGQHASRVAAALPAASSPAKTGEQ